MLCYDVLSVLLQMSCLFSLVFYSVFTWGECLHLADLASSGSGPDGQGGAGGGRDQADGGAGGPRSNFPVK